MVYSFTVRANAINMPRVQKKQKKDGVTGNRTPDLSHAKGILYH